MAKKKTKKKTRAKKIRVSKKTKADAQRAKVPPEGFTVTMKTVFTSEAQRALVEENAALLKLVEEVWDELLEVKIKLETLRQRDKHESTTQMSAWESMVAQRKGEVTDG